MTVTDELEQWIAEHGSDRDALNVALARLTAVRAECGYWITRCMELRKLCDLLPQEPAQSAPTFGGDTVLDLVDRLIHSVYSVCSHNSIENNTEVYVCKFALLAALGIEE